MLTLLALLVAAAVLLGLSYASGHGPVAAHPDDEDVPDDAVERHLGALNYGTTEAADRARRQLLSLGAGVVPQVAAHLERVDTAPQMVTPMTQLRLEDVVSDFGLAGLLELRRHLRRIHEQHAAYPAALRIVQRLGPHGAEQMLREDDLLRWRYFDATVWRMSPEDRAGLAAAASSFAPSMREHAAFALAVAAHRDGRRRGEVAPVILSGLARAPGPFGRAHRAGLRATSDAHHERVVALAIDDVPVDIALPQPWESVARVIAGTAPADERERVFAMMSDDGEHADLAMLAMACALPDSALPAFQRRLRTGRHRERARPWIGATCLRLGDAGVRAAIEVLRTGRGDAGWLAWDALLDADLRGHGSGIAAAWTQRRGECLAMAIGALVVADEDAMTPELVACIDDDNAHVAAGAMSLCGLLRTVEAVAPMIESIAANRQPRVAARAIELVGGRAAAEVHSWCRRRTELTPEVERVRAMVTGLAERRA